MIKLSVNINKIATIRNARGGSLPDPVQAAISIQNFGADGITVHPRPDERHITRADVFALKKVVHTEYNIEGYPSEDFLGLIMEIEPTQVTLVPDGPDVLTSNAGWDCVKNAGFLSDVVQTLHQKEIRVSLFLDPIPDQVEAARSTGADRIELYTEAYARIYKTDKEKAIEMYLKTAQIAAEVGLGVNAGHDLNLANLRYFTENIPQIAEVSIGHALISDALLYGLNNTVAMYKEQLNRSSYDS